VNEQGNLFAGEHTSRREVGRPSPFKVVNAISFCQRVVVQLIHADVLDRS
jgi:hypothetical protein